MPTGYILLAFYAVLARQQGADLKKINRHHPERYPERICRTPDSISIRPKPPMRIITDIFEWCSHELPR